MKHKFLCAFANFMLMFIPFVVFGQPPSLGTTENFVLFSTSGAITNSGTIYLTHLTGNIGTNIGSSTGFGNIDGQIHDGNGVSAICSDDLLNLHADLISRTVTFYPVSPLIGNGETLVAGVYQYPLLTAATLDQQLILDAQNDPNALFIIRIDGALNTEPSSKVVLANGALACNVFWVVNGQVSMATQTTLRGTIIAFNAAIAMSALDTLEGRALSINGAITTNSILAYKPVGCGSVFLTGATAPTLGSATDYGVFSSIGSVTSTPITYIIGDVGSNSAPTTGFEPLNVTGIIHLNPDSSTDACASDLLIAYNYLNALTTDIELSEPTLLGNDLVLTPHVYHLAGAVTLTGNIILNAQGNPNAVFVININGAFSTYPLSVAQVILINGTQAKNVYWKVDGATHLHDNTIFNGNIIVAGAITIDPGTIINGRVLTINGAIEINGSYINIIPIPCVASDITGNLQIYEGDTTTLFNVDTGGVWMSSDPLIATIDSSTGLVTGVNTGISSISFTSGLACETSVSMTINPIPVLPQWLSPEGIDCNQFTLIWQHDEIVPNYQLQVALDSQFQQLTDTVLLLIPGNTDRYTIENLEQGREYFSRIRSIGVSDTGVWSTTFSLSTLSVPAAPPWLPGQASTCHEIHLQWSDSPDAITYLLDVSEDSLFQSFLTGYQQRDMGVLQEAWVSGLRASRAYYSRVAAINACGSSAYSTVYSDSTTRDEWLGIQASWHVPQSWCSGYVPDQLTDVWLPVDRAYMPEITGSAMCRSLQIDSGAHLFHNTNDTFSLYGNWVHQGRFHRGNGTLLIKGDTPQWLSGTDTLNHLLIDNILGVHLDNQSLWVLRGYYTPVIGTLFTSGRLQVYNDSLQQGGISREISPLGRTEGVVQYRQIYSRFAGPRLIGSPFYNTSIFDWWAGQYSTPRLYMYYEHELGHKNIGFIENWNMYDTLGTGVGYWAEIPANNELFITGNLTEGTVNVPVSFTVDPNNRSASGWNLRANPYLCPIDWNASEGFVKTNISTTLHFLDPETGIQAVYNNGIGTLGATSIIPPGQAFWLKAYANNPVFIMDERIKVQASGKLFREAPEFPILRITLHSVEQAPCEALICLRPGTSAGYEPEYDALFPDIFETMLPDRPQIWIENSTGERYTLYNDEKTENCKVCIKAPHSGIYTLETRTEGNLEEQSLSWENQDINSFSYQVLSPGEIHVFTPGVYCPWKISGKPGAVVGQKEFPVKVFPNPLHSGQELLIQKVGIPGENIEYRILNPQGIQIYQGHFSEALYSVSQEIFSSPGIYFLELMLGEQRQVYSVIYLP